MAVLSIEEDYYNFPALNASSINDYYRSPLHFWKRTSLNPNREKKAPTPAMIFGNLCHCLVLQPEVFDSTYVVAPKVDKRTKEGKAQWSAFEALAAGKIVIDEEQYNQAVTMRDAMFSNPDVKQLLGNGCSEHPITWQREEGGILCKAKLDYLRSGLLLDYKTTENASQEKFSRSIADYGYHRSMAWYMEGAQTAMGEYPRGAVLICQEKEFPEAIAIWQVDGEVALEVGAMENNSAYDCIKRRLETGDWRAYHRKIKTICLPKYYDAFKYKELV